MPAKKRLSMQGTRPAVPMPCSGQGKDQRWQVAGVGASSVGAVEQPGRPLGPLQRLVDRQPVGEQPREYLADHLAVGTHHRVLQLRIPKQRQHRGEVDVHTERRFAFAAAAAVAGKGLHGLVAAEGGAVRMRQMG
jgi:hypothetical protein